MDDLAAPRPRPAGGRALCAILAAGVAGQLLWYVSASRTVDLDALHAMSLVRAAVRDGALPRIDPFAWTPTVQPFVHHEWGTGALLYAAWTWAGWGPAALGAVRLILIALVVALAGWSAARRGATPGTIAATSPVAALLLSVGFVSPVRAQAFTVLFTAVLLVLLERDRRGDRRWIGPWLVAHVVWLNLHGGFVVGLAAVGAAALERVALALAGGAGPRRAARDASHLLLLGAAMSALVLANPYGPEYVAYLWRALTMSRRAILEWGPLWSLPSPLMLVAHVVSVALFVAAALAGRGRALREVGGWALVAVTSVAALLSARHLSLHAVAWFTFVAPALARAAPGRWLARAWDRVPLVFATASLLFVAGGARKAAEARPWSVEVDDARLYPVGAVEFLSTRGFRGRLLTSFGDGSYVSWRLHPAVRVSFDIPFEAVYPREVFEAHERFFAAAPGWRSVLERYPPDAVLVRRASPVEPLLEAAPENGGAAEWSLVYRDDAYALFARAPPAAPVPRARRDREEAARPVP